MLKIQSYMNIGIVRLDVMLLINLDWWMFFAGGGINKNSIMNRVWYHFDMRLLKYPEILETTVSEN